MKSVNVDKDKYREFMVQKVIPKIKTVFPRQRGTRIIIQQDNASPHGIENDPQVRRACSSGPAISIINQPSKSPDFNVLDLGFFSSIQTIQNRTHARSISELINEVTTAFDQTSMETLDNVWLSLHRCLLSTLRSKGGNQKKMPRSKDSNLFSSSSTSTTRIWLSTIICDEKTYNDAKKVLQHSNVL